MLLEEVSEKLAAYGLPLQLPKWTFHVPDLAGTLASNLPRELAQVTAVINYSPDGVTLLGTQACQEQATPLVISGTLPLQAQQRVDKALMLARRVRKWSSLPRQPVQSKQLLH